MKNPNRTPGEKPKRASDAEPSTDGTAQDAIALLKGDHRTVEELFGNYASATSISEKTSLATRICRELIVHTLIEEELFYPACRDANVEHDDLDGAQIKHDTAKLLIAELMTQRPDDAYFDAKVKVLSEYIRLHVGEEENPSDGIFARAQSAGVDMDALGPRLQARRTQLLGGREFAPPRPRSLHVRSALTQSQESNAMPRYSQDHERDERGRFVSDDDYRGDRWRDDNDDHRRASHERREEPGRFMRDDDYDRGRYYERNGDHRRSSFDRDEHGRDRDEHGRFMSHDERGGMYSSHSRYGRDDDDYRGSRMRDEEGRFMGNGERHGGERDGGRGWYGDPRGHAEASQRGWEHRSPGRYADDDDRRGYGSRGGRHDPDDDRGHGGWFGDAEGHAEAARRGWRNR